MPKKQTESRLKEYRRKWGIPDWRVKEAYPQKLSDSQWRWEFLRRREDYRADWEQYYPITADYYRVRHPLDPFRMCAEKGHVNLVNFNCGPLSPHFQAEMPSSFEKYGLKYLLNPALSAEESFPDFVAPSRPGFLKPGAFDFSFDSEGEEHPAYKVPYGCVATAIDLRKPFAEQIRTIERGLKDLKPVLDRLYGGSQNRRKRREEWSMYLRTLDARAETASYIAIGKVLRPDLVYSEGAARAKECYEAAKILMKSFPA